MPPGGRARSAGQGRLGEGLFGEGLFGKGLLGEGLFGEGLLWEGLLGTDAMLCAEERFQDVVSSCIWKAGYVVGCGSL